MGPREKYQCKRKTYEFVVATSVDGYTVSVYEEGKETALRIYTVNYLANSLAQQVYGKLGVEALKELARHDIERGWL